MLVWMMPSPNVSFSGFIIFCFTLLDLTQHCRTWTNVDKLKIKNSNVENLKNKNRLSTMMQLVFGMLLQTI